MRTIALLAIAGPVLLAACTAGTALRPPVPHPDLTPFAISAHPVPFTVEGSVLIKDGDESSSGSMVIDAGPQGVLQFRLLARFTGSLVADVRLGRERLLLLDHANSTYFLGPNSPDSRRRWLALDVSAQDMLMLVTGRIVRAQPVGNADPPSPAKPGESVKISSGGYNYRFLLGALGLPVAWDKRREGVTEFRVEVRRYRKFVVTPGSSAWLPEKIRVYDALDNLRVVLGVRSFNLNPRDAPPIEIEFSPGENWKPLTLD